MRPNHRYKNYCLGAFRSLILCVFSLGLLCLVPSSVVGQSKLTDSLEGVLALTKGDSIKLSLLISLGKEFYATAGYDKALQYVGDAKLMAKKTGNKKAEALCYNIAGSVFRSQGNYEASLQQHFTALKIREQIADSFGISNSYNNIGLLYWGMEKYDLALNYHFKALRIRENLGDSDVIAASHLNLGMTYYKQGMQEAGKHPQYAQDFLQSALVSYQKALTYFEHKNAQQSMAACYNNMANVFADKASLLTQNQKAARAGYYTKSLDYYFKTLAIMQAAGDQQSVAITLNNISLNYRELGDFVKATEYVTLSLEQARKAGAKNEVMEALQNFWQLYEARGEYQKAFEYHKAYSLCKDSLLNEENNRQMVEMETKYETEKKDKELLKKDAETKQASLQRNFFIGGFVMMFLLAFLIFRSFRQKQKANLEIQRQKLIVEEKQKEILDSIYYARRIQRTLLTGEKYIQKNLQRLKKSA